MRKIALSFATFILWIAQLGQVSAAVMLSNLNSAGNDIQPVFAGTGFAVGFLTGPSCYTLNSVTLEEYGYGGPSPYFHVQLFTLGPIGSVPPPGWAFVPVAELNDAGVDPRGASLIDYTPASPLTLSPNQVYFIGASAGPGGTGNPGLIFASTQTYSLGPDWQMYIAPESNNQWELDPNYNLWVSGSPNGYGLKLEINATAVPEPSLVSMLLVAFVAAARRRRR